MLGVSRGARSCQRPTKRRGLLCAAPHNGPVIFADLACFVQRTEAETRLSVPPTQSLHDGTMAHWRSRLGGGDWARNGSGGKIGRLERGSACSCSWSRRALARKAEFGGPVLPANHRWRQLEPL